MFFEALMTSSLPMPVDSTFLKVAVKSAVYVRPWSYILQFFEDSLQYELRTEETNEIIRKSLSALRKVKFVHATDRLWYMRQTLEWMKAKNIKPNAELFVRLLCFHFMIFGLI